MAFTLPKVPRVKLPKTKRRAGAHRDDGRRPHPVVPPGGASRRTNQRAKEEYKHRGEHRATGGVHRGPREHRARDPFGPRDHHDAPWMEKEARQRARARQRPAQGAVGQPQQATRGNPRGRFGDQPARVTDLAPAYRAAGTPARTPTEQRRHEQSRDALIRATKAAQAERKAGTGRGAAEHQPPGRGTPRAPRTGGATYRSQHASRATAKAPRPTAKLPGSGEDVAARKTAAAAARKGSSGRDPRPQASHPFFAGGNRAAPHVHRGEKYGEAT